MKNIRFILATLIAPLTPTVILALLYFIRGEGGLFWWGVEITSMVSYLTFLIFGIPTYILFRRLEWSGLAHYVIGGILVGVCVVGLLMMPNLLDLALNMPDGGENYKLNIVQISGFSKYLIPSSVFSGISSAIFWFIARPDIKME
jgi:hypothetical protein